MAKKLEITRKLERMGKDLKSRIAILNLPAPYYCTKGCKGCISSDKGSIARERRGRIEFRGLIKLFAGQHGTRFITVNGRGDPFHPMVVAETLEKIRYAYGEGMQSYVFSAGQNLEESICDFLAGYKANVMISLFGNSFMDESFFDGRSYSGRQGEIADNIRRLMAIYAEADQPEKGTTRIGMNYVISENDLESPERVRALRKAAECRGIFFICNTNFGISLDGKIMERLRIFAAENSTSGMAHSTFVDGRCQMGAGSSITIAPDGEIYRCPYMLEGGDGKITEISNSDLRKILDRYLEDRSYFCILRKTRIQPYNGMDNI